MCSYSAKIPSIKFWTNYTLWTTFNACNFRKKLEINNKKSEWLQVKYKNWSLLFHMTITCKLPERFLLLKIFNNLAFACLGICAPSNASKSHLIKTFWSKIKMGERKENKLPITYWWLGAEDWLSGFRAAVEPPAFVEEERVHLFSKGWPSRRVTKKKNYISCNIWHNSIFPKFDLTEF